MTTNSPESLDGLDNLSANGTLRIPLSGSCLIPGIVRQAKSRGWETRIAHLPQAEEFFLTFVTKNGEGVEVHKIFQFLLAGFKTYAQNGGRTSFNQLKHYPSFRYAKIGEEIVRWALDHLIAIGAVVVHDDKDGRSGAPLPRYSLLHPEKMQ